MKAPQNTSRFHLGIAEQGKLDCMKGKYSKALHQFRQAIRLCAESKDSDVFFQHYSQCVMEVLELMKAHEEVIAYCDKIISHIEENAVEHNIAKKLMASTLERAGIQCVYLKEYENAKDYFKAAQDLLGKGVLPLTDQLLVWVQRGLSIRDNQILSQQKKHGYFVIQKEKIKSEIAIEIPMAQPSI